MSNEDPQHLADYLRALLAALQRWEPQSMNAIRKIVGERDARMVLDADTATVCFKDAQFTVRKLSLPASGQVKAPYGRTDRATCLALLAGYQEVSEAIMNGKLLLHGAAEDIIDMCAVIEILVDASTRIPEMQRLAEDFRDKASVDLAGERRYHRHRREKLRALGEAEKAMLERYGL